MSIWSRARGQQLLALSLLLSVVTFSATLMTRAIFEPLRLRVQEITDLNIQLSELNIAGEREALLHKRQADIEARLEHLSVFWSGISRTQVAIAMQDLLRSASQQSKGRIISSSVIDGGANAINVIAVRARISGTLATLQHVLAAIEQAKPLLFVDTLVVTAPSGPSTPGREQELSFELSASGYWAMSDAARFK